MFYKELKRVMTSVDASFGSAKEWLFAVILLITALVVFVPLSPRMPQSG